MKSFMLFISIIVSVTSYANLELKIFQGALTDILGEEHMQKILDGNVKKNDLSSKRCRIDMFSNWDEHFFVSVHDLPGSWRNDNLDPFVTGHNSQIEVIYDKNKISFIKPSRGVTTTIEFTEKSIESESLKIESVTLINERSVLSDKSLTCYINNDLD